tara:strand:- start:1138 stop:1911 length:774 start_codon:yes stop_codon:yes gene_type:complete
MSGQIESMDPLPLLPPMVTFAEGGPCEKGETAAKTGCTPASGEGGPSGGGFSEASETFKAALASGDQDAAMEAIDSMEASADGMKALFTGPDKGARKSIDGALDQMRIAVATGDNEIASSYGAHLADMASIASMSGGVASRQEAKGKGALARKILKAASARAGGHMEQLEAKMEDHGHNQATGLLQGIGDQLGSYIHDVGSYVTSSAGKKALGALGKAVEKVAELTPKVVKGMKRVGILQVFKDLDRLLKITDANVY